MKILALHCDFIEFQATKKAIKSAPSHISKEPQRIEDCLVILTSVEKRDEDNVLPIVKKYVEQISDIARQLKASTIVIYPYAHLSSSLSSPSFAENFFSSAALALKAQYQVFSAPFGWYKSFNIKSKGHPLSELSRDFSCDDTQLPSLPSSSTIPPQSAPSTPLPSLPAPSSLSRHFIDEPFAFSSEPLTSQQCTSYTAALLLASVIHARHPQSQLGSIGFYHDQAYIDMSGLKIISDEFKRYQHDALALARRNPSIKPVKSTTNPFAQQIIADIQKNAKIYRLEGMDIVPLFSDPFLTPTSAITALHIFSQSSAYWKNNQNNQQLIRIYLVAFTSASELEKHLQAKKEAENRSHIKIGKEHSLFVVSDLVGPGLPLLAPRGMIIRSEIIDYLWQLHKDKGYQQVWSPHIARSELYQVSGHWDKFGDELFKVKGKADDFILKPMNCPHHMQIFSSFSYSYRDMPVRFFEPATIYRDEKSGQLAGLSRVRSITQDDGHLFCRTSQIIDEVGIIVNIIHQFYRTLGMDKDYWVSLSVRGDDKSKYLGSDKVWAQAEASLEQAAKHHSLPYKRQVGEAAFYGPKLDFIFKDALGRPWQLATIQYDFNLPERFDLSFTNESGHKERPVVIHRAISGSLERFMSILIEHFAGRFPLWLSPIQVKILTVTDRSLAFARELQSQLRSNSLRVEVDESSETISKKVRRAQLEQANYIVTIGDKELSSGTIATRTRQGQLEFGVKIDCFIANLRQEIDDKIIK